MADDSTSGSPAQMQNGDFTELDWITLKNDIGSIELENQETVKDKFIRKFQDNPFVPIGCGLTTCALCCGLWCFSSGRTRSSQKMMRFRVLAQGFTVAAMMFGIVKTSMK
ncbi:HIG1 domain family member 2A, mitochondrial [Panulirus ornatus]|uniref:HIG1 domain family member 2A, mitochondrial n=1 Tax=Panulirus ornatus TaxID=150431 RepID=UPI003A8432F0